MTDGCVRAMPMRLRLREREKVRERANFGARDDRGGGGVGERKRTIADETK